MSRERQDGGSLIKLIALVFATPVVTAALVATAMVLTRRTPEPEPVIELSRPAAVRSAPAAEKKAPSAPAVIATTPDPAPEPDPTPEPDEPPPPVVHEADDAMPDPADPPVPDEEPDPIPPADAPVADPVDPVDPVDPDPELVPPDATVWTLDDFQAGTPLLWKTAAWENPATLRVADGGLTVEMLGGARDKTAVGRTMNMDVSSRSQVVFDVVNDMRHTLSVAVAFIVGPNSTYYESVPVPVKPGLNENIAFDLRSATFKSAASQWQHQRRLGHVSDVKSLYVLIYTRGKGSVVIRNVRLLPGEPVAEGEAP